MSKRVLCVSLGSTLTERDILSFFFFFFFTSFHAFTFKVLVVFSVCVCVKDVCKFRVETHYEIRVDIHSVFKRWAFLTHTKRKTLRIDAEWCEHTHRVPFFDCSLFVVGTLMKLHVQQLPLKNIMPFSLSRWWQSFLKLRVRSNLRKFVCHTLLTFT